MKQKSGFTIVELLIVIVVIAILATISIVTYRNIQTRANATAIAANINQVEKSFKLWLTAEGMFEYPRDTTMGPSNPKFSEMAAGSDSFARYVPMATSEPVASWKYDNDKDTRDPAACVANSSGSDWSAVNIVIDGLTPAVAQAVDDAIDDGNLLCGKIRQGNGAQTTITYKLSFDQKF